jgi:dTDP-4-dehydrorhamnose reductase
LAQPESNVDLSMTITTTDASASASASAMSKHDDAVSSSYVIVLTGASGYLGQHFLQRLLDRCCGAGGGDGDGEESSSPWRQRRSVTVHALQAQPRPELATAIQYYQDEIAQSRDGSIQNTVDSCPSITVVTHSLDIASADAVSDWMDTMHFKDDSKNRKTIHCCVHTAAISSPGVCQQDSVRAMAVNVPKHFFSALLANNPAMKIIALSTDQVYRGDELSLGSSTKDNDCCTTTAAPRFYTELHPANEPVNVYGQSKRALEDYLLHHHHNEQTNTVVLLRSSLLLGPLAPFVPAHDTFLHFCQHRALLHAANESTTYYTNEVRSVLAVHDAVDILLRLADPTMVTIPSGVYCMGGPHAVSRHDLAVAVLQHCGYPMDLAVPATKEYSSAAAVPSPLNIAMDSSRLWQLLFDEKQPMSLTEIVAQTFPQVGS